MYVCRTLALVALLSPHCQNTCFKCPFICLLIEFFVCNSSACQFMTSKVNFDIAEIVCASTATIVVIGKSVAYYVCACMRFLKV